jgi:signal transduction histidine kinase
MSHELRTPLNATRIFRNPQARNVWPSAFGLQGYAGDIHRPYRSDLISDILGLSRIEAGRRDIQERTRHLVCGMAQALSAARHRKNNLGQVDSARCPN